MLDSLRKIIDKGEFEDNGSLVIENAMLNQDDLLIRICLTLPDGPAERRSILCRQPRSHSVIAAEFADHLDLCDNHVLLWPHCQQQVALYFNGRPADRFSLLGSLVDAHYRAVGDWIPFTKHVNSALFSPSCCLLDSGSGLLAEGPAGLIDEYRAVLQTYGIRQSSPPAREPSWWDGARWRPETEKLYALIMGTSYVVAPDFSDITA